MQIQNIQRYIIWGMLAAVAYLILIQWQKDYGKKITPQEINKEFVQTNKKDKELIKNDDIPSSENIAEQKNSETKNTNKTISIENLITIKTKTVELTIDLVGGDIIKAALPKHSVDIEHPQQALKILQNDLERSYIAQSGIVGKDGPDAKTTGRPLYKADAANFELGENEKEIRVPLYYEDENGVKITKTFILQKGRYQVNIEYEINNETNNNWNGNIFAQIKRDNSKDPLASTSLFAMKPFLGVAYWSPEKKYNKIAIKKVKEDPIKITHKAGWVAFVQHYFISAWIAPTETNNVFTTRVNNKQENIIGFTTETINIEPKQTKTINYSFYVGPKNQYKLKEISDGLELTVDYGWLWMIAQFIFWLLLKIQSVVSNWGLSIILLTCTVKAVFFPLNQYAFKSMANMRKLQPKMQRLKEQYGDDRQKLSQATMEMYRKEKINPLGSCLPMIIQMPVFISLYWVLSESVEIRHAEFIFWIKDLSIMDPYFVLPGLMAISMIIQQRLSPMVFQDPMQERVMKLMPIMFAFFFLFFPAGLVLYWLVNNMLTIAQQWIINRSVNVEK